MPILKSFKCSATCKRDLDYQCYPWYKGRHVLNCFLKGRVNEEKLQLSTAGPHFSKRMQVLPCFSQPLLSTFKLQILKNRALLRLQVQNLSLSGSSFCHFPHLDSMIHTLETAWVPLTIQKCLLLTWPSLLRNPCFYLDIAYTLN